MSCLPMVRAWCAGRKRKPTAKNTTRQVRAERFFHVNRLLPYSLHPLMQPGQHLNIGAEENPFFRFFRTYIRTYPVTQSDGTVRQVPAMTFLRQVVLGMISPANLPGTALEIAQHFVMLSRELIWEDVRTKEFPNAPSRQRAIWLLTDLPRVAYWQGRLRHQFERQVQIVEMLATGTAHECDASLLLGESESLDDTYRKARDYWNGVITAHGSEPEILFEGEIEVMRIVDPSEL